MQITPRAKNEEGEGCSAHAPIVGCDYPDAVRVLIAPEAFGATLGATQAAAAIAAGWAVGAPHDRIHTHPLGSGGPGLLDVLAPAVAGRSVALTVSDPLSRPVPAEVLLAETGGQRTAYLDASQAAGLHLLAADERDPALTSSWGVGELIAAALSEGATRIVVGIDSLATNDGGAGALGALGAGPAEHLARGGTALAAAPAHALAGLAEVATRFADTDLVVLTRSEGVLLGLSGTSALESPDRGASPATAQALEGALGHFADLVRRAGPVRVDLLTGMPRRLDREPGAGAGGGLGYGLMLLGARRAAGAPEVLRLTGFGAALARHDLVVTGTGTLDGQALRGSVVAEVAGAALGAGVPSVALAGEACVGRRELMALGLSGSYALAEHPGTVGEVLADPVGHLTERAARVARTWSPRRS